LDQLSKFCPAQLDFAAQSIPARPGLAKVLATQAAQLKALYNDDSPIDRMGLPDTARRFGRRGITRRLPPDTTRSGSGKIEDD
jgi:hypothetical protein